MSTYHHGDLRPALLRAAGKVLEKRGIGAISLRRLARLAGVSHNAPYRHFADREALLAAMAADGFAELEARLKSTTGREIGEAYVRFALEHPQRFRLMFGGPLRLERYAELRAAAGRAYELLVAAIRAEPGIADAETAAAAAWSLVHGLAHLLLDGHLAAEERFIRRVIRAVRFAAGSQRSA